MQEKTWKKLKKFEKLIDNVGEGCYTQFRCWGSEEQAQSNKEKLSKNYDKHLDN